MRNDLIERIQIFLKTYASISPNWDGSDDDKYTSPDAHQLENCAEY